MALAMLTVAALTDVGLCRAINQDALSSLFL